MRTPNTHGLILSANAAVIIIPNVSCSTIYPSLIGQPENSDKVSRDCKPTNLFISAPFFSKIHVGVFGISFCRQSCVCGFGPRGSHSTSSIYWKEEPNISFCLSQNLQKTEPYIFAPFSVRHFANASSLEVSSVLSCCELQPLIIITATNVTITPGLLIALSIFICLAP